MQRTAMMILSFFLITAAALRAQEITSLVNPFIGTGGHGHTYPGASLPFGMVQLSPDTRLEGWDGCSGYHYSDSVMYGFSHTHLSGTGIPDYADVLLMPARGKVYFANGWRGDYAHSYASRFSHEKEVAEPGYYRVFLQKHGITAELTATERAGMHRYSFSRSDSAYVILDLLHRDRVTDAYLRVVSDREVEGYRFSTGWARDQRVFFVARFSRPFRSVELLRNSAVSDTLREARGDTIKAALHFELTAGEPLLVKVGISAVDVAGARKNLDAEIPGWEFDRVREQAAQAWNRALSKIRVQGGRRDNRIIFYTALYHSQLVPNLFSDVDGRYRGMDGKIHHAENRRQYTVFSLWDTFRAEHPLFTIIEQHRTREFIQTFLAQYEQGGVLPIWELAGNYTGTMIGYHAIAVIADAYIKGIRGFDAKKALEAMKHSAELDQRGLRFYKRKGFIGSDDAGESVSRTLEYAYDDWCIAQMAQALGDSEGVRRYLQRAQNYKNLFDPSTGFFRARRNGGWFSPFDPFEVNFNYTEANAWQYLFFVPQDISGLIHLMGGPTAFESKLDSLFSAPARITGRQQPDISGMIGQYAHGNEPSHHMAYLYNYVGAPWKTQRRVHEIMTRLYRNAPDGLAGNEDCGQMSAWFVLSALGLYPVTPGSPVYVLGTPLFERATIRLENGKHFEIVARGGGGSRFFVQSARLNGRPLQRSFVTHEEIMAGGVLEFELGPEPNRRWGARLQDRPVSVIAEHLTTPAPFFGTDQRTFVDSLVLRIGCADPLAEIHYTLDGSVPGEASPRYKLPIVLRQSCVVSARAFRPGRTPGPVCTGTFKKLVHGRKIRLLSHYANQYSAGGDFALIDGIRGKKDFRTGLWQGYEGQDFDAIVDLGEVRPLERVAVGFLQDIRSWIFFPREVTILLSSDGAKYDTAAVLPNPFPDDRYGAFLHDFSARLDGRKARYVRVFARYYGPCPPWHPGAGGKTWLFVDEIVVEERK